MKPQYEKLLAEVTQDRTLNSKLKTWLEGIANQFEAAADSPANIKSLCGVIRQTSTITVQAFETNLPERSRGTAG